MAALAWCRLHVDWSDDARIQSMPERMQRRFVMLMNLHTSEEIGRLTDAEIACKWRISRRELEKTKALFLAKGFIDGDWYLQAWERRNPEPAIAAATPGHVLSGAERTRRYRERLRERKARETQFGVTVELPKRDAVTLGVTDGDVTGDGEKADLDTDCDERVTRVTSHEPVTASRENVTPFPSPPRSETAETLEILAIQLVLAHPYALERGWTVTEVPVTFRVAAAEAIVTETRNGVTRRDAGLKLLELTEAIARGVPRGEWRYLKRPDEFFRQREYRLPPERLTRQKGPHEQDRNHRPAGGSRLSPAAERQRNSIAASAAAFGRFFPERYGRNVDAHAGPVPEPGAAAGDGGHVPGGVDGDGPPLGRRPVQGCTIDGHSGQVEGSVLSGSGGD